MSSISINSTSWETAQMPGPRAEAEALPLPLLQPNRHEALIATTHDRFLRSTFFPLAWHEPVPRAPTTFLDVALLSCACHHWTWKHPRTGLVVCQNAET